MGPLDAVVMELPLLAHGGNHVEQIGVGPLAAVIAGLVAGLVHVLIGPDHLAAVAPLATGSRRRGWIDGFLWGIGHSTGTWIMAAVAIALTGFLPIEAISSWSERLVGIVLIAVGLWAWRRAASTRVHTHRHDHEGHAHAHMHAHWNGDRTRHQHGHAALGIGTLHGLAGTSHLLGVLPALAFPTRTGAVAYVVAFGVGSIVAMTAFAFVIGSIAGAPALRAPRVHRALMGASAVFAIGLGVWWLTGLQTA